MLTLELDINFTMVLVGVVITLSFIYGQSLNSLINEISLLTPLEYSSLDVM